MPFFVTNIQLILPSWAKYVAISMSLYIIMTLIELMAARAKGESLYKVSNSRTSILLLFGHYATSMVWIALVVYPVFSWLQQYAIFKIGPRPTDGWAAYISLSFLALVALDDFVYYVHHWFAHRVKFFWAIHHTHHSSNVYNVLVAARNSWFDVNLVVFWFPLVLLGYDARIVLAQHGLSIFWNIFIHTKLVGKLGFLESFLMTPSNHRVHHAVNKPYLAKNLGCTFVIWDKLFGTYAAETEPVVFESEPALRDEPLLRTATYGIRQSIRSKQSAR